MNTPEDTPDRNDGNGADAPIPKMGLGGKFRAYFLAGILVTAPIGITFYLAWLFVTFMDEKITPLIPLKYNPESYLPFGLPGLGLIIAIIALSLVGALTAGFVGRLYQRFMDRILTRVPVLRGIYAAVKQILETVLAQQSKAFREAVLIEYPRRGIWAIAFITGRTEGEVQNMTEEDVVNIFLPTTPNPTSGFLLFVPRKELVSLSMGVDEAIKMVISGGIVTPPDRRSTAEQARPQVSSQTYEDIDILREKENRPILVSKKGIPDQST